MDNNLIEKIKSIGVLEIIFNYINDVNFKHKLFSYSKLLQKRFNIKLFDYQERYIKKIKLDINNYLYALNNRNDKNILNEKLQKDLLKYKLDINILQMYINKYYTEEKNKIGNQFYLDKSSGALIDIKSPFFEFLSKSELFEKIFTIIISAKPIENFNLKNDYILAFNNLNKSNSKYSSIQFYYKDNKDIDYLKDFKINFSQIKKLIIDKDDSIDDIKIKNDYFLKNLFSFFNIENNLLYLEIDINIFDAEELIDPNLIENINNLKLLEHLDLKGFKLKNPFILKLFNLKHLFLDYCEKFTFEDNSLLHLNKLRLNNCFIDKPKSLLKLPNIEKFECINNNMSQKYSLIFDFSSFNNIKEITSDSLDFLNLKETLLENVQLSSKISNSKEIEKEMITKLLQIKTLKEINLELNNLDNNDINDINIYNTSITDMEITWNNKSSECILYNLQNKLPNLSHLHINAVNYDGKETNIEIKEKEDCKITKFDLSLMNYNIKFYCIPYENLISVNFHFRDAAEITKDCFPLFNDNCKVIFKSLTYFYFNKLNGNENINLEIFKNIYNNLPNVPNLKSFKLNIYVKDINEELYKNFIRKVFNLKLEEVIIFIKNNSDSTYCFYTEDELKKIFPEINLSNIKSFGISKLTS